MKTKEDLVVKTSPEILPKPCRLAAEQVALDGCSVKELLKKGKVFLAYCRREV